MTKMVKCKRCEKMVRKDGVHTCYDAAELRAMRDAPVPTDTFDIAQALARNAAQSEAVSVDPSPSSSSYDPPSSDSGSSGGSSDYSGGSSDYSGGGGDYGGGGASGDF